MTVRVLREGTGHVILCDGHLTIHHVMEAIDQVEADKNGSTFLVSEFAADAVLDLSLDELHAVARRLRGSHRRGQRNAFVFSENAGVGPTVADYRIMVASLTATWNDSPVELETFSDRDEAIRWASAAAE